MNEKNIFQLSVQAGQIFQASCSEIGKSVQPAMLAALASGLDVGLTVVEQSTNTHFDGLSKEAAVRVIKYFREEAIRMEEIDMQIALFYRSWVRVLESAFLKDMN